MFTKVVLFTVLALGAVNAQDLIGSKKCAWGPAYWCADISSAKECNAVKHCMTTSWKNNPIAEVDADDCCTTCETVVDKLRNYSTLTERDVLKILNTVCDVVPDDGVRQQCKDGVEKYVKEVLDMVVAKIDSKKICTLIRLCKKSQDPVHRQQPTFARVELHREELGVPVLRGTETCEMCKLSVIEAKNFISNVDNQNKIVQFLRNEGCSRCPSKDKCEALIDEYAKSVFMLLEQELDPDVLCGMIGLCGKTEHPLTPVFLQMMDMIRNFKYVSADTPCDVCKNSLAKIRAYFADPQVRAAVQDLLKNKLCALCLAKDKCQADLSKYADQIFKVIDDCLAKSDQICQQLGLCSKRATVEVTVQNKKVFGVQCTICEFVMRELDDILKENRTEQAIIQALDKVCGLLPSTVRDECVGFVAQYGQMVINLLVQELDPAQICTILQLCDGTTDKAAKEDTTLKFSPLLLGGAPIQMSPPVQAPQPVQAGFSPQCVLCEYIMSKLDTLLADNATEIEIIQALDKVCSIMPSSVATDCRKMVDEYGPAIIKILVSEMNPTIVCTVLGLCPVSGKVPQPRSSEFCEACETAMIYLDSLLKENATQEEVEHLLLKICNFLPESIRGECNMVVMLYTPEIVQLLVNELSPVKVCSAIKLCPGMTSTKPETFNNNAVPMVGLKPAEKVVKNLLGVDTKKCMYGPSYWCASRFNAKKCKMTAHCQQHFWNKNN